MLKENIEKIVFHQTDNDKKINGVLNYNISKFNLMKYDYEFFNSEVIREIIEKLNNTPFKQLDWKLSKEMIIERIKIYL